MKLVIAVVSNDDSQNVIDSLREAGFYSTTLATTGGFLRVGNTTLMVGTEDVDTCVKIIGKESKTRTEIMTGGAINEFSGYPTLPVEVQVGGATIFVLDVEQFIKI